MTLVLLHRKHRYLIEYESISERPPNLEKIFELFTVMESGDVGRELQQVFGALPPLFDDSLVKPA